MTPTLSIVEPDQHEATLERTPVKLEDEYRHRSVDVETVVTSTAAVTLTFNLQNLTRLSVGASGYSLYVSSRFLK